MRKYYIAYLGHDYQNQYIDNSISNNKQHTMQVVEKYLSKNHIDKEIRITVILEKELSKINGLKDLEMSDDTCIGLD